MEVSSVIRGVGLITAAGRNVASTWDAVVNGLVLGGHTRIDLADDETPRVTQLGRRAAAEAMTAAGWSTDTCGDARTALIVGTSKGPIEQWLPGRGGEAHFLRRDRPADGAFSPAYGIASTTYELAVALGFGAGPRLTVSAACASGLIALIRAGELLRDGLADRVLVVGVESSLHDLFVGSFSRLGVLAPPGYGCRPFDVHRQGFYMSEAAAAVCLESGPARPGEVILDGRALAGDATHLTGLDPAGRALAWAITDALARGVPGPVDLVHAHGTGTPQNDAAELAAFAAALPDHGRLHLFSHKAALGHTQGAAGLISVVLNVCAHRTSIVPPNAATTRPEPSPHGIIAATPSSRPVRRSLVNATGFGGPVAVVGLRSAPDSRTRSSD